MEATLMKAIRDAGADAGADTRTEVLDRLIWIGLTLLQCEVLLNHPFEQICCVLYASLSLS